MKTGIPLLAVSWSASHWIRHLPQKLLLTWQWCGECLEGECGSNAFFLDLVHTHTEAAEDITEEATALTPHQQQRLAVETLLIVGNDDTDVSLDLITKSAQIPAK